MIVAFWALLGCHHPLPPAPETATVTGQAMGGNVRITVRCPVLEHSQCIDAALVARSEIERIEHLATDFSPEGEISQLNASAGGDPVAISPEVVQLLQESARVSQATDGAFDITIGALWGLWDFRGGQIADPKALAVRLPLVDWHGVHVSDGAASLEQPGMAVTLGGIAQGYAASRALDQMPGREAAVDVSGDIAVRGTWTIGIQHPRKSRGTTFATLSVRDAVLTTSGDYEQGFVQDGVRYHHVLDPKTGMPARGAISATVVHPDGAIADALATALVVRGADADAVSALGAWALVVTPDGVVHELGARDHVTVERKPTQIRHRW